MIPVADLFINILMCLSNMSAGAESQKGEETDKETAQG